MRTLSFRESFSCPTALVEPIDMAATNAIIRMDMITHWAKPKTLKYTHMFMAVSVGLAAKSVKGSRRMGMEKSIT